MNGRSAKRGLIGLLLCLAGLCAAERLRFEDRATSSGLSFRLENAASLSRYLIETMTGGCAWLDFDGDGLLDAFLVNGAAIDAGQRSFDKSAPRYWNRLYRNRGGGKFEDVTSTAGIRGEGYGIGAAVGDYDNDGHPDIYVTGYGRNELYHNTGKGTFHKVTDRSGVAGGGFSSSAVFFDYDRDGFLDLYVCRYLDWSFQNHKVCGRPGSPDYCHPRHFQGVPGLLFHNNGDGTFTDVSRQMGIALADGKGLGVAAGDVDRDGWPDLYIANDSVPGFLFHNRSGKAFDEAGLSSATALNENGASFAGMGVDIADYDNDGWPDIIATALSLEGFVLFHNQKKMDFLDSSTRSGLKHASFYLSGWGAKFVDFDHDGWKDLFVANGHVMRGVSEMVRTLNYFQPLMLLTNREGRFSDSSRDLGERSYAARGAAFGDFNNDGNVDVLVQVLGSAPLLLENPGHAANRWVGLELTGTRSNRDAAGARVTVADSTGRQQTYWVSRGSSYLSASDPRIVVGLGERELATVGIEWPSGRIQQVRGLPLNRYTRIREEP